MDSFVMCWVLLITLLPSAGVICVTLFGVWTASMYTICRRNIMKSSWCLVSDFTLASHFFRSLFVDNAISTGIRDLYPPFRTCIDNNCLVAHTGAALELKEESSYPVTLFTSDIGAVPVWTTSLYCRSTFPIAISFSGNFTRFLDCKSRYHHNYVVHDSATLRAYYAGVPDVIQLSERFFIESSLCDYFANQMMFSWCVSFIVFGYFLMLIWEVGHQQLTVHAYTTLPLAIQTSTRSVPNRGPLHLQWTATMYGTASSSSRCSSTVPPPARVKFWRYRTMQQVKRSGFMKRWSGGTGEWRARVKICGAMSATNVLGFSKQRMVN